MRLLRIDSQVPQHAINNSRRWNQYFMHLWQDIVIHVVTAPNMRKHFGVAASYDSRLSSLGALLMKISLFCGRFQHPL